MKKRAGDENKYSTISLKFVDGTMRHLQGTSSEIQKLYNVLRERQKWFADVKDLGESNRKWQSEIQTAARKHYDDRIKEDQQKYDELLSTHIDTMRRDHENTVAELKKMHEMRLQSIRQEHELARRHHDRNTPSVDETMRMHTACFRHESVCRKLKRDLEKYRADIEDRALEFKALRARLEEIECSTREKIRNQHLEASHSRASYTSRVVDEMDNLNRHYEEEFEDMGKNHHMRLEGVELSVSKFTSHAKSDLVAMKMVIENKNSEDLMEKRMCCLDSYVSLMSLTQKIHTYTQGTNFESELNILKESIMSESTLLKSMKLRERYEHDRYVEEKRLLKSKISNAKFKIRAKRDRALHDLKHVKFKLNRFVKDSRVLRKDVSGLEDKARENQEHLNEMLKLKANDLNTLETNYESRAREVVLENESLSKEWIANNKSDVESLKCMLNEQRRIAIEHLQNVKAKWVRLSQGEEDLSHHVEGESVENENSNSRFSNITLRAMRVAEVMKSKGQRRDIVVSNLRRALRDRAVDLEMALGMVCDWYENKTKLDDLTESSFDRALRSIDRLLVCD